MMELTEDFFKLLIIALIVAGVLALFFTYIQYTIIVMQDRAEREAVNLGNSLLDSDCLTYSNTKSLFSEENLESAKPWCFDYPYGTASIELLDDSYAGPWFIEIGDSNIMGKAEFIVAVKLKSGEIKPAKMVVEV